ncbi:hypothetical protein [Georgenia deserti]|uniref:Uncharacterized protein n=1 Tax=Georgenia deserti TaxID=2093781 RepID=A0ABW4L4N1_9MICO
MATASLDRRRFLWLASSVTALGAGLTAAGATPARADEAPDYTARETFDDALAAFIDSGATGQHWQDNEEGALAWGQSYVLLGIMRMYETYRDTTYLDTFVTHADAVLGNRDEERGVTDHQGRSGPVWRAGGNYVASHITLTGDDGAPLVQIRNADSRSAESTVEVLPGAQPGTFTLAMTHVTIGTTTLEDVSTDPSHPRFVETVATEEGYYLWGRWTAKVLADGVPRPGTYEAEQQYYAFAVHTGMVTYPMAIFARTVLEDPALSRSRYRGPAQRYLTAARRAVAFHDGELRSDERGTSYVWPQGAPVPFDGTEQPLNQSHGLGLTMAELYRITGDAGYRSAVEGLAETWRADLVDQGGWPAWPYWPTWGHLYQGYAVEDGVSEYTPWYNPSVAWEDVSHAAISVEFAAAAHGAGLAFDDADLEAFARSYLEGFVIDEASVRHRFLGPDPAADSTAVQTARWLALDRVDGRVGEHALGLYEAVALVPGSGSHLAGIAYLNYAAADPWS